MKDVWARLEKWMAEHVPEWLDCLNPGADEKEIVRAERELGIRFPDDFRESLKIHNGENPQQICCFIEGWMELLSLDRILEEWKIWKAIHNDVKYYDSDPDPGIKNDWFNLKWIPITSNHAGDHHCLDLDPADGGKTGQVIWVWHDDATRSLEAHSFREWMERYVSDLEAGKYRVTRDEYGRPNLEEIDVAHL